MNKILSFIKKTWNDSVWSKVISYLIIAAMLYIWNEYNSYPQKLLKSSVNLVVNIYYYFYNNPSYLIIFILFIVVLFLFIQNQKNRTKLNRINKKSISGINWILSINEEEMMKYLFLLWFPVNHRLSTDIYQKVLTSSSYGVTFDHVPEIRKLISKKILIYRNLSSITYKIEIDSEVYDFLENEFNADPDEQFLKEIDNFKNVDFYELFKDTGQKF